jgi:hypothetical protein
MANETYTGGELAALLEVLLKALNVNLEPFDSVQAQLDLSETVGQSIDFHRAITAIKELYRAKPHVIDALHASVAATLREIDATGLWRSDKYVAPSHVKLLCSTTG